MSNIESESRPEGGHTAAQRAGIRKTVTIVVLFVMAVFAWTIFGKYVGAGG